MKPFQSPLFIISCVLFVVHQVVQKGFDIHHSLIDSYLDNLVAMPIILTLLQVERAWLFRKGVTYRLPVTDILLATLYVSIISEYVFPLFSRHFTFDWVDFICFFTGAGLYILTTRNIARTV